MLIHPKGRTALLGAGIAVAMLGGGAYLAWTMRAPQWYAVVYDNVANRSDYEVIARTHTREQCGDALRNEFADYLYEVLAQGKGGRFAALGEPPKLR